MPAGQRAQGRPGPLPTLLSRRWPELLAAAFALVLYAPAVHYGFVFDDHALIGSDGSPTWLGGAVPYRPVRWASYLLDWLLGGSATVYHAHNIALHALVAALTVHVARRIGAGKVAAVGGALLLVAHPLAVEAVAYVAGRRDVLAVALGMTALAAWLHGRTAVAAAALAAAAGAKESGLVFAGAMAAASACGLAPVSRHACSMLVAATAAAVALAFGYGAIGPFVPDVQLSDAARIGHTVLHYAGNLVWPLDLAVEYPNVRAFPAGADHASIAASLSTALLLAVAIVAAAAACCRNLARTRCSPGGFALAWTVIAAAAVAVWGGMHEPGADRHAYVLLPAMAAAAALGATHLARLAKETLPEHSMKHAAAAVPATVLLLCVPLAAATRTTMPRWQDQWSLWTHAVSVAPHSVRARHNIAMLLADSGEYAFAQRHLTRALRTAPDDVSIFIARAAVRCARGRGGAARHDLVRAAALGASGADVAAIDGACEGTSGDASRRARRSETATVAVPVVRLAAQRPER